MDCTRHRLEIREDLEKVNKVISDAVKKARETGKLGVQIVIRPVGPYRPRATSQMSLSNFR